MKSNVSYYFIRGIADDRMMGENKEKNVKRVLGKMRLPGESRCRHLSMSYFLN